MAGLHLEEDAYIGSTGIRLKDCIKETLPVGTIIEYPANSNLPTGFMICDGSAISRTTYADLFAIIGTSFGSGDGSTTFNLPNKQGKVTVGYQSNDTSFNTIGKTGGEKSHQLTVDEMPAHKHSSSYNTAYDTGTTGWGARIVTSDTYTFGITNMANIMQNTGGNGYHNNLQPYIVSNFIIKVSKTSVMTSGSVVDNLNGSSTTDAPSVRAVKDALNGYCNDIAFLRGDGTSPERSIGTAWQAWKITALNVGGQHGSGLTADTTNQRIIINRSCTMLRISASYNWYNNLIGGDHVLHITRSGAALRDIGYFGASKEYNYYQMISGTCIVTGNFVAGDYIEATVSIGQTGTEKTFSGNDNLIVEIIQ